MLRGSISDSSFRFGRWLLGRMGMSQIGWRAEPRIYRHPGPVAEQTCCGAVPFVLRLFQRAATLVVGLLSVSALCLRT
jgi:hypothetical protein